MATERGSFRFTVKETGDGTTFLAAEATGDTLEGLNGLLCFHLEQRMSLGEAKRIADFLNRPIASVRRYRSTRPSGDSRSRSSARSLRRRTGCGRAPTNATRREVSGLHREGRAD
jgi:hypothetical protein